MYQVLLLLKQLTSCLHWLSRDYLERLSILLKINQYKLCVFLFLAMGQEVDAFYELIGESKLLSDFFTVNRLSKDPIKIPSRWDVKNQIFAVETETGK